jgi:hypothetical protein
MDGLTRRHATIPLLFVIFSACSNGLGAAEDAHKRLPDNSPIYAGPRLEKEFLGAVSVNLRLDDKAAPRRAELGLMELVSPKGAKPTRYKTKLVPVLLEKAPGNSEAYVFSRFPADLIKPDEILTIRLNSASGEEDSASLAICGSDGNVCREIKLTQVGLPKEPVKLESEKADDAP